MPSQSPATMLEPGSDDNCRYVALATGRRRRTTALFAAIALGFTVMAMVWVVGLVQFAQTIRDDVPPGIGDLAARDAIIVLTGGRERIPAAFSMLAEGKGNNLLVSGVHGDVGLDELVRRGRLPPSLAACCVHLDHVARDTVGNAAEAAAWAEANGVDSIWLVTSNYHMPRSVVEFHQTMPDLQIASYPVASPDVRLEDWWRWPGTTRLVVAEYNKFLYASVRSWLRGIALPVGIARPA
jgi:uncharacterized SAM-binding protein YcdF (DUF218 family)